MLIAAIFLFVAILTSSVTYAWLMLNQKVEEDTYGMSVKVTPNLIISFDSAKISTFKADDPGISEVNISAISNKFTPATHYSGTTVLDELKCLSSYSAVDKYTGLDTGNATLISLPTNDGKTYYVDYTVYIASTDIAIENTCLSVSLTGTNHHTDADAYSWKAGSVDFYLTDTTTENFKGTLNLAGIAAEKNNSTAETTPTTRTSLTIELTDDTIPKNTEGSIKLILRCYFDGALCLKEGTGDTAKTRCYVNTATVSTDDVTFNISISEIDKT